MYFLNMLKLYKSQLIFAFKFKKILKIVFKNKNILFTSYLAFLNNY